MNGGPVTADVTKSELCYYMITTIKSTHVYVYVHCRTLNPCPFLGRVREQEINPFLLGLFTPFILLSQIASAPPHHVTLVRLTLIPFVHVRSHASTVETGYFGEEIRPVGSPSHVLSTPVATVGNTGQPGHGGIADPCIYPPPPIPPLVPRPCIVGMRIQWSYDYGIQDHEYPLPRSPRPPPHFFITSTDVFSCFVPGGGARSRVP